MSPQEPLWARPEPCGGSLWRLAAQDGSWSWSQPFLPQGLWLLQAASRGTGQVAVCHRRNRSRQRGIRGSGHFPNVIGDNVELLGEASYGCFQKLPGAWLHMAGRTGSLRTFQGSFMLARAIAWKLTCAQDTAGEEQVSPSTVPPLQGRRACPFLGTA